MIRHEEENQGKREGQQIRLLGFLHPCATV